MQVWVRNVTVRWLSIVATLTNPSMLNIWRAAWRSGDRGDIVLFRPEPGGRAIAGYGFLDNATIDFASEIWRRFGRANGVDSLHEFLKEIIERRTQPGAQDPAIGNTLIKSPVFFPTDNRLVLPEELFPTVVVGALTALDSPAGQDLARRLSSHAMRQAEQKLAQRRAGPDREANDRDEPGERPAHYFE